MKHGQPDPFGSFRHECEEEMKSALSTLTQGSSVPHLDLTPTLEDPPNQSFGQLASSISFELAKRERKKPIEVARLLVAAIDTNLKSDLVETVEATEPGYVNFRANMTKLTELTLDSIRQAGSRYGLNKAKAIQKTIVEHTSANPARPIHIGTAKGAIFGDTIARLLAARGHDVRTHFYIDDAGRQVAIMAYGYKLLQEPSPTEKPDHFIGKIYSITSTLVEIEELKKKLPLLKTTKATDAEIMDATKSLDEWVGIAADLQSKYPAEFNRLSTLIAKDPAPEKSIQELIRNYEKKDPATKKLMRRVTELVMTGFENTLRRARIRFDEWDWESDLLWKGNVAAIVAQLKQSGFTFDKEGAQEFDAEKAIGALGLREKLGLSPTFEIPPLTLIRSDGTSLYEIRDVAYTLEKFSKAETVVNVIGTEQSLAQLQVKVAFWIIGHQREAEKFVYFPIGLITLEGQRMSARRGLYFTFDHVLDETIARAKAEIDRRSPSLPEEIRNRIADRIAISAVRYAILSVEAAKSTNFVWGKVLNFEANSAAFINYAYTRSSGILRKLGKIDNPKNCKLLKEPAEQALILELSKFPEKFAKAADGLDPTLLCLYTNQVAQRFHEFYERSDISHVSDEELKWERVSLVLAVRTVLNTLAGLLGLELVERM